MMLFISSYLPEKILEESHFNQKLIQIAQIAHQERQLCRSANLKLDIAMHLPGKKEHPHFSGLRISKFSQEQSILYFEAAIPASWIDRQDAQRYIIAVIKDCIDGANEFCHEENLLFDPSELTQILQKIEISVST